MELMIEITKDSLDLVKLIDNSIKLTFHHHYHILYDISKLFKEKIIYVEIGCYGGGSACLMLQRNGTDVISIDLGYPISKEIVINNVNKLNKHNNNFTYIEGDSHSFKTIDKLNDILNNEKIDILFIDGGHFFDDVIQDFTSYENMVKDGGYIVFDDYNDYQYSPEVNNAVNYLVDNRLGNYNIIGTFKNTLMARPKELEDGNCFVIQKKII